MCEQYSFKENIGILYHFLDGYLSSGAGSNYAEHAQLLRGLGIRPGPRVTSFKMNTEHKFNIESFQTMFKKTIEIYLNMFNDRSSQIHITGTSRHQITFLRSIIRDKADKKYYLSIVNSGAGLENHYKIGANYNIWHTYNCDENISNYRTKPLFYMLPLLETCARSKFTINNETEKKTLIRTISENIEEFTRDKIQDDTLIYEIIDKIISGLDFKVIVEQKHELYLNLFYEISNNLLGDPVKTIGTIFSEAAADKFVTEWDTLRAAKIQITNSQIYKREIIKDRDYLLTSPQKSGSCAWFSFFWAVVAYYVKSDNKAIEFINNIDDRFSEKLKKIFSTNCLESVTESVTDSEIDTEKLEHPYYTLNNLLIQQKLIDVDTSATKLEKILNEKLVIQEYIPSIVTNVPFIFNCENAINDAFAIAKQIRNSEDVEIINTKITQYINTYLNDAFLNIKNIDNSLFGEIIINLFMLYHIYINHKYDPSVEYDESIETDLLSGTYVPILDNNVFILLTKKETHRCQYIYNMIDTTIKLQNLSNSTKIRNTCWAKILEDFLFDVLEIWFTVEFLIISNGHPIQKIFELLKINNIRHSYINRDQIPDQIRIFEEHDMQFNEKLISIDTVINDSLQFPEYDFNIQPFVQLARHNESRSQYLFSNKLKKYSYRKNNAILHPIDYIYIRKYISLFNNNMISQIPISNNVTLYNVQDTYNTYIANKLFEEYEGCEKNIENLVKYIKTMKMESYMEKNIEIHEMILNKFTPMANGLFKYNEVEYTFINENNLYTFFGFINRGDKNMVSGDINKIKTMTAIFYGTDHYMFVIANAQCDNTLKKYAKENIFLNQSLYLIKYIIATNTWTVNGNTAIINPSIKDFPFMIFAPCNCLKIMYKSNGLFNLFTWGVIEDPHKIFGKETFFNALDLNISSNLIIPIFNTNNFHVLKTMYSNFGAYDMILNSLNITQLMWNKLPKDISPSESDALREYMKFHNTRESHGYKYIPNIAQLQEICKKEMPRIELSSWNYIINEKIADNMPECVKLLVKKVKSHISIDYNKMKEISDTHTLDYNTHMTGFLKRNPVIKINQGEAIYKEEILECIEYLTSQIHVLNNELRYKDDDNLLNFIYENAQVLLNIIQINLMIKHLYAINKIVSDNKALGDYKFAIFESSSNMEIPEEIPDIQTLIFMIYFGNFLKTEQIDKYNKMIMSMNYERELFPVHHIMMGKGKSAVITPLVVINSEIKNKKSYVIVPGHLLQQTSDTFNVINEIFNLTKVKIIDDNNVKHSLLYNNFDSNDSILIMDEIDMMLNPLQSTYQISTEKTNLDKTLAKNMLDVLKLLHRNKGKRENIKSLPENITPFLLEEITTVYNSLYVKNINYGMSRENKSSTDKYYSRIVIPYARKDSPLEKSEFSSIIVSFVLSFKYFYENMSLEKNDLYNIWKLKDTDIIDLFSSDLIGIPDNDHFISRAQKIYNLLNEETKIDIIDLYLQYCVFPMIKISGDVRTCSMVDIMGMDNIFWEIGYSGTIDVDFPQVKTDCDGCKGFDENIDIDYDEEISMNMIFRNKDIYENTSNNKFEGVSDIDQLWRHINANLDNRYSMLIDLAGLLKDMDNLSVVKYIAGLYNQPRSYIYLDNKNNKYIYEFRNDTSKKYNGQEFGSDDEVFYYYSQQHTVGIDFKQPAQMRCLVAINTRNTRTETAQALWRARKMIRGHYITILLHDPKYKGVEITGGDILDMLTRNSASYRDNQKGLLDYQNIKWLTRKQLYGSDKYLEPAIPLKYILNEEPDTSILKKIAINAITNSTKLHSYIKSSSLFTSLCSRLDFKNIVLGTNTTQFVADAENRNEVDIDIDTIANSRVAHTYNQPRDKKSFSIIPWCFVPSENLASEILAYTHTVCTFEQNEHTCEIVYSSELFNDIYTNINIKLDSNKQHTTLPCISLVKLLPRTYLLANPTIMKFCYNKFLIYNVYGILINKYGKLANDNQVKEGNEKVEFPEYIKILSGDRPSIKKFDIRDVPTKIKSLIFLLIKNGMIPKNIKDIFPPPHKRNNPESEVEKELHQLILKTNKACDKNRKSICKKIIEYAGNYTALNNKATDVDLQNIIRLYKLPEDQPKDQIVSGGGYNVTQISEYYKKYTTIKNKYLQLKSSLSS